MNAFFSALNQRYLRPLARRLRLEQGLEAVEYALIAALVSAVVLAAVTGLRDQLETVIDQVTDNLGTAHGLSEEGGDDT